MISRTDHYHFINCNHNDIMIIKYYESSFINCNGDYNDVMIIVMMIMVFILLNIVVMIITSTPTATNDNIILFILFPW